jgi:hypothetical protein
MQIIARNTFTPHTFAFTHIHTFTHLHGNGYGCMFDENQIYVQYFETFATQIKQHIENQTRTQIGNSQMQANATI